MSPSTDDSRALEGSICASPTLVLANVFMSSIGSVWCESSFLRSEGRGVMLGFRRKLPFIYGEKAKQAKL